MSVCVYEFGVGGMVGGGMVGLVGGSRKSKGGSKLNVLQRTGGPN